MNIPSSNYFSDFLLKSCKYKEPFEPLVIDKKPKTHACILTIISYGNNMF